MNPPSPLKAALQSILLHLFVLAAGGLAANGWLDEKTKDGVVAWFTGNLPTIAEWIVSGVVLYGSYAWIKAKHLLAAEYVKIVKDAKLDDGSLHPAVSAAVAQTADKAVTATKVGAVIALLCLPLQGCAITPAEVKTVTTDGSEVAATVNGLFTAANALWGAGASIATSTDFTKLLQSYGVSASDIASIQTIAAQGQAAGAVAVPATNALATYLYNLAKTQG